MNNPVITDSLDLASNASNNFILPHNYDDNHNNNQNDVNTSDRTINECDQSDHDLSIATDHNSIPSIGDENGHDEAEATNEAAQDIGLNADNSNNITLSHENVQSKVFDVKSVRFLWEPYLGNYW